MSQQQTYGLQRDLGMYAGMVDGIKPHHIVSGINDLGMVRQVSDLVITPPAVAQTQLFVIPATVDDSVTYTITINGVDCDFAADADSTQAELRDGMIAAINAAVGSAVTATASGNDVLVTADEAGVPFTFAIDTSTTNDITAGAATANIGDGTVYAFTVDGFAFSYETNKDETVTDIRDAIIALVRASADVDRSVLVNPSGNNVRFSAYTPGTAFVLAESDANLSISVVQANVATQNIPYGRALVKRTGAGTNDQSCMLPSAASQVFFGVALRVHHNTSASAGGNFIAPGQVLSAIRGGEVWVDVEEAVAVDDPVFFRHTASGANTDLGKFRNDADTASCDQVPRASFRTSTTGPGRAKIELVY